MRVTILTSLLVTGFALAVPLLLAALGELIAERAGVLNVGIEGMALVGALAGFGGAAVAHSAAIGAICAAVAGASFAGIFALLSLKFRADQVVVGTAINILALGVTGVFARGLMGENGATATAFAPIPIPIISKLPIFGPALFAQNALGYLAWLFVPATAYFLFKTQTGLRLRAVGEYPRAADGAGVNVNRVRWMASLWGGALAGLAGASLSIGYTHTFVENMTAGRGFIALAVVILGRWNPFGTLAAALLFGVASALQFQFQTIKTDIPYQVFLALPYVLTLLALLFRARSKTAAPAALGEAYQRG